MDKKENAELLSTLNGVMQKLAAVKAENVQLRDTVSRESKELQAAQEYVEKLQVDYEAAQVELQTIKRNINLKQEENLEFKMIKPAYDQLKSDYERMKADKQLLQQKVEELTYAYKNVLHSTQEYTQTTDTFRNEHLQLQSDYDGLKISHDVVLDEYRQLVQERDIMLQTQQQLQPRLVELENYKAEGMAAIEEAKRIIADQDSPLVQDKELIAEVERLNGRLQTLKQGLDQSVKDELKKLKANFNQEKHQLYEQNASTDAENSRLVCEIETLRRDISQFQSEQSSILKNEASQLDKRNQEVAELHTRLNRVSTERDALVFDLDVVKKKLAVAENSFSQEQKLTIQAQAHLQQRVSTLEIEAQTLQQEVIRLFKACQEKESLLKSANDQRIQTDREHQLTVKTLESQHTRIQEDMQSQISVLELSKVHLDKEVSSLHEHQNRQTQKFKSDVEASARKHELAVQKLKDEQSQLAQQFQSLKSNHQKLQAIKDSLDQQHSQDTSNLEQLTHLLQLSNDKVNSLSLQVQDLIERQSQLIQEKKQLQRQVDQLILWKRRHQPHQQQDNLENHIIQLKKQEQYLFETSQ